MAGQCYQKYMILVILLSSNIILSRAASNKKNGDAEKKMRRRQMGLGMDMSMGLNMAMNMVPSSLSGSSFVSMSNPLSLQMPFAPNPFHNQMFPTRRHQISLDGNGQDFLDQPLNPYEKVLNSKYPTSPFERLFGKSGPLSTPAVSAVLSSYQTNSATAGGFDDQGSSGYMDSYERGDFGVQFGRRRAAATRSLGKSKLLRLSTVRSDVFYSNEAYADYFGW